MTPSALALLAVPVILALVRPDTADGPTLPDPWWLAIGAVLGYVAVLVPIGILGMALTVWTLFLRSLDARFAGTALGRYTHYDVRPLHRTRVTGVYAFLDRFGWIPPWPALLGAIGVVWACILLGHRLALPGVALIVAGLAGLAIGAVRRWRRWRPKVDPLPPAPMLSA